MKGKGGLENQGCGGGDPRGRKPPLARPVEDGAGGGRLWPASRNTNHKAIGHDQNERPMIHCLQNKWAGLGWVEQNRLNTDSTQTC